MNDFRRYYWLYWLNILFYVYLMILVIIKISFSFAGHVLKPLGIVFFFLDLFVSYFVMVGFYFVLDRYLKNMYIYNGHYLIIFVYTIAANSLVFTAGTIFKKTPGTYNWFLGFFLMEISTYAIIMNYFHKYVPNLTMSETRYLICIIVISVVNFYVAFDAYLMVNYRTKLYNE